MTATVAIVDDHGLLASVLRTALVSAGHPARVEDAPTRERLVERLARGDDDVVLLDLDLGALGDGLGLIEPIVAVGTVVVVVTADTDPVRHARCLRAGATGVLDKARPFHDLLAALQVVLSGGELVDPHRRRDLLHRMHDADRRRAAGLEPFERLTPREAWVLGRLMEGLTAASIADRAVVSVATVRTQIKAVREKLGVRSQVTAVARAREAGWRPPDAST